MRGRSYTPSPPRGYGRRRRSPSPRGRYGGRDSRGCSRGEIRDGPTSLLVRNLRHDCRPEDLRRPFGQFGEVKDIYLPRDYHTGEPRGFGFIQYLDPVEAAECKHQMDGQVFQGRQLTVVFAEENRKKPTEMRDRERGGSRGSRGYERRRSPPRYSRSPPPRYGKSSSRDYYSPPPKRERLRSISPQGNRHRRERSFSPDERERSFSRSPVRGDPRSLGRSPGNDQSPYDDARSPIREHSPVDRQRKSLSPSRSRSRSLDPVDHARGPRRDD